MKVKELIHKLQKLPQDANIEMFDYEFLIPLKIEGISKIYLIWYD